MTPLEEASIRLRELLEQESAIQFDSFDYDESWTLGKRFMAEIRAQSLSVAVAIWLGEQRVFHAAGAGTSADNDHWIDRKVRVVRRFGHSSLAVKIDFAARGKDFDRDSHLPLSEYSVFGGAFPIRVRGSLVGVVGVSGLKHLDDHAFVVRNLEEYLRHRLAG